METDAAPRTERGSPASSRVSPGVGPIPVPGPRTRAARPLPTCLADSAGGGERSAPGGPAWVPGAAARPGGQGGAPHRNVGGVVGGPSRTVHPDDEGREARKRGHPAVAPYGRSPLLMPNKHTAPLLVRRVADAFRTHLYHKPPS